MDTGDSDDGVTELGPSLTSGPENAVVSGGNAGIQKSMKTEQIFPPCSDFRQENIAACSSANTFGSMVSMAPTTVLNQGGHLPPGVMTVPPPSSCPEQIVVAMQNMNGATGIDDGDPKALVNSGSMNNSIHMPKLNYTMANTNSLPTMATSGPMLAPTQLANMMSLAGLPQVTALAGLNGVAGLNVVSQLAAPAQMMQQIHQPAAGVATACVSNTALPGTCPPNMVATANGQPHAVQQVQQPQMAGTPQFILAAGQPIQGIQGAQLLIPTSSGVATQQVITIPVSQLAGNQVVQLVASNGQIFTTTLANLQALSQPVPVPGITPTNIASNPQAIQPHQVLSTAGYTNIPGQMTALPQIFTNPAGQLVAFGPQIIAHPLMSTNQNGNVLVNPQLAAGPHVQQIPQQEDKSSAVPPAAHTNGQPAAIQARVQNASMSAISQALAMHQQPQAAPIAMNAVTMVTSQLAAQPKPQTNGQPCPVASKLPVQPGTVSTLTQTVQPQAAITPDDNDPDNCLNQAVNTISNTEANVVDGINLEEIKEFAKAFKIRRLSLGLTQTQVGQALSATEGPSYSQSAICRFEKLDITPRSAQKIKPVLERWMKEAEERYKNGAHTLTEFIGSESTKKRKRRTSFTPAALDVLNQFFEKNTHPTGVEMTELAEHLLYDREVVRVWFCNKRQALKNTIKKLKATSGPGGGVQCS